VSLSVFYTANIEKAEKKLLKRIFKKNNKGDPLARDVPPEWDHTTEWKRDCSVLSFNGLDWPTMIAAASNLTLSIISMVRWSAFGWRLIYSSSEKAKQQLEKRMFEVNVENTTFVLILHSLELQRQFIIISPFALMNKSQMEETILANKDMTIRELEELVFKNNGVEIHTRRWMATITDSLPTSWEYNKNRYKAEERKA
jgi:hypothetical protein